MPVTQKILKQVFGVSWLSRLTVLDNLETAKHWETLAKRQR